MKKLVYTCDLCGRDTNKSENMYSITVKSASFINYANFDMWGADKKTIDICQNCVNDIKEYIKKKHKYEEI